MNETNYFAILDDRSRVRLAANSVLTARQEVHENYALRLRTVKIVMETTKVVAERPAYDWFLDEYQMGLSL